MHLKKLHTALVAALLTTVLSGLHAQDIHFTQFNMSPLTLNPAHAGRFEGTVRVGGIYRSQWTSILSKRQFETPSAWVDAPIIRGFRRNDWVGAGLMFFQDNVGSGILKHSAAKLGATYHLALNKKATSVLSLGIQWGNEGYRVDDSNLRFEQGYLNATPGQDYSTTQSGNFALDGRRNFSTFGGGAIISSRLNKTMDFLVGFTLFNATTPKFQSLLTVDTSTTNPGNPNPATPQSFDQPQRAIFHGTFNIQTSDRVTISPTFIYQTTAKQDEIMVQAMGGYLFDPEKDITLQAGLGYRLGDAVNILLGAKIKDLRVGLAYDVNTSGLSNDTNYRGGFELAANYIIKIYKKATVKPKVLCPRF